MNKKFTTEDFNKLVELLTKLNDNVLLDIHADEGTKERNRLLNAQYSHDQYNKLKIALSNIGIEICGKSAYFILKELSDKWGKIN